MALRLTVVQHYTCSLSPSTAAETYDDKDEDSVRESKDDGGFFLYSLLVLHSTDEDIEVEMAQTVGANNWYPRLVIFCCSHNVTATSAYVYKCIRLCVLFW